MAVTIDVIRTESRAMHEASLVDNLLRQVDELAACHGTQQVSEVRLEIGLLSGVEPLLLRAAFDRLKAGSCAAQADLLIDDIGLKCRCSVCGCEYSTNELQFLCPTCGSVDVTVIGGDGVLLVSATLVANS